MRRNERWVLQRSVLILAILIGSGCGHWARANAEIAEDVFARARELSATVSAPYDWREAQVLKEIQRLLDRIVYRYPNSDLASRILSREVIDGFDVAEVDIAIASLPYQSLSEQIGRAAETDEPMGLDAGRTTKPDALPEILDEAPLTEGETPPQDTPELVADQAPMSGETASEAVAPATVPPPRDETDPAMPTDGEEQVPSEAPAVVRVTADTPLPPRETLAKRLPDSADTASSPGRLQPSGPDGLPRILRAEIAARSLSPVGGDVETITVSAVPLAQAATPVTIAAVMDGPERPIGAPTGETAAEAQRVAEEEPLGTSPARLNADAPDSVAEAPASPPTATIGSAAPIAGDDAARDDVTEDALAESVASVPTPPSDRAAGGDEIGPEVTWAPPHNPMAAASEPEKPRERSRDRPLPRRVAKPATLGTATGSINEGTEGPEPAPETATTPDVDIAEQQDLASESSTQGGETPTASGLRQVDRCFPVDDEGEDAGVEILIDVQIDPDGRIAALPDLIAPTQPNADERRLYAKALSALDACAPYVSETAGIHRMAASPEGLRLVNDRPEPAMADAPPADGMGSASDTPVWRPASRQTEDALSLSGTDVADVQARLSALGFDPMGVDGRLGENSRAALAAWQSSAAIPATGFLNEPQLTALREQSASALQTWMQDDANRALVEGTAQPEPAKRKSSTRRRASLPPGYFWYKGRMCKKVLGNLIYSCK